MFPSPRPLFSWACHALFTLCLLGAGAAFSFAQPSGGPYGPQAQVYELPKGAGHVYFVAPDAKAGADGLALTTPCTIDAALERVVSGDAVILRGGEYRTGGLIVNQGVLLQAYAGEQPVLKGTLIASDWTEQKNGLWRTHWTPLFPAKPAAWWRRENDGIRTPLHRFNMDMVFVDGRRLHSAGWEGELDADSFYIDYERGDVYITQNPKEHRVEITAHNSALVRTLSSCHGKDSDGKALQIRGIAFTHYAYRALEIEGREPEGLEDPASYGNEVPGSLLENVSITQCSRVAAYLRGRGLVIRNCLISDTTTEGLYLIGACDSLLERNIITRNNVDDMRGYFPSAVKIFNQSHRVVCRDNLVIDNPHSNGIWYDVGNCDAVMANNWIENAQNGFFFEISKRALAVGNVFVNCEAGLKSLNSCGVEAYHNTFINAPASFERNERSAVADHFGWHPSTGPDVDAREGHVFVGNLLYADANYKHVLLQLWQAKVLNAQLTQSQLSRLDGNVYVVTNGAKKELLDYSPVSEDKRDVPLASLAELRARNASFETTGTYLQTGDRAFFRSIALKDFRPLPGQLPRSPSLLAPELSARLHTLLGLPSSVSLVPGAYQVAP